MTTKAPPPTTVDAYVAGFPPRTQRVLQELRASIHATVAGLTERISYGIPTFDLDGRYLVYVGGFARHVSLYPITDEIAAAFGDELAPYRKGRGTLKFPLGEPLPTALIARVVRRVAEERRRRGGEPVPNP